MAQTLRGKTAIITGGSKGLGLAIAQSFHAHGAKLVLVARNEDTLNHASEQLKSSGAQVSLVAGDVCDQNILARSFAEAEAFGGTDILVNCAGIFSCNALLSESFENWPRLFAVNVTAVAKWSAAAIRSMKTRGEGKIINLGSIASRIGSANMSGYVASKHAVLGLTRSMALELSGTNILVFALCPGIVQTELGDQILEGLARANNTTPEEILRRFLAGTPAGQLCTADEVSASALFLAKDGGRGLSGQAIDLNGARFMA